ncbi:MAG: hypothetical protein KAI53_02900 [Candidatus Aenigmarchaeota archaeon]|nr:hypothetical protein [Candidatus Aenigmarchaeota archaeon]
MSDNFVGERILQPKKEIMSFLASKGVLVPRIYDSIDEAINGMETKKIMLRSEHPQDYEGSSDLFPNGMLNERLLKADNVTEAIMSQEYLYIENVRKQIDLHCRLLGLDYNEFMGELSHSAWEKLEGINRVICADSAIKGKYHIVTLKPTSYDVIEDSTIQQLTDNSYNSISLDEAKGLVELYEQIRDVMDTNHCYIVETQSVRNYLSDAYDHYALQVHRGVDFQNADFKAEPNRRGVLEFHNVRGATSVDGEDLLLTIKYPKDFRDGPEIIVEDASADASEHSISRVFSEIMFRKRKLQIFPYRDGSDLRYELTNHCSRNALFKPKCSVLADKDQMWNVFGDLLNRDGLVQTKVNFVSDGRRAYLTLLD